MPVNTSILIDPLLHNFHQKEENVWILCVWSYTPWHVHSWQEDTSIWIWHWWKPNSPCILFCVSDNWKNFPQISFWLCKFQNLSLSYYPLMSGARHCNTDHLLSVYDLWPCTFMFCHQSGWVGRTDDNHMPHSRSYTRSSSNNLSIHASDWEPHKYIPLAQTKYVPLATPQKCLQPCQESMREVRVESVVLSDYSSNIFLVEFLKKRDHMNTSSGLPRGPCKEGSPEV